MKRPEAILRPTALLTLVLWTPWAGATAAADCAALLDSRQVLALEIAMDPSEWKGLQVPSSRPAARGYRHARLRCEGGPRLTVGIRRVFDTGDAGDLERSTIEIAVDRFVTGQTLAGHKAFALFAGTRAPEASSSGKRRSFVDVIVNEEFAGLFTIVPGTVRETRREKIAGARTSGSDVVINEILANTPGSDDIEFIELYNAGTAAQDLGSWYLLDNNDLHDHCPLGGTLGPGEYLVVPGIRTQFMARFPGITSLNPHQCDGLVQGQGFGLGNTDDQVRLFREAESVSELVDILTYGRQGADVSFGYRPHDSDAAEYLSAATPGATNGLSELHSPVCINEFQTTSLTGGVDDWIELYNRSDAAVDISGWFLSDNAGPARCLSSVSCSRRAHLWRRV